MSIQESLKIVPQGEIAVIEWDLVGEKVNKLSGAILTRFHEIVKELKSSRFKAVVLISRKPGIFIAGADIEEIQGITKKEDFARALEKAHEIFCALEDLPIPTIAAIHGACLGGGCELVLACDYRFASDDPATRIGLPEVKLGIIPGFGGCVRLPRVVGVPNALDIILAGKAVDARKAQKIGLIDQALHPSLLEEHVFKFAREVIAAGGKKRRQVFTPKTMPEKIQNSMFLRPVVFAQAKKMTLKSTYGHYPAPLKALEVVRKTYGMSDRARALKLESAGFCEVAVTDVSRHLINVFFLMESVKKKTGVSGEVKPLPVHAIGVLGAGTMGGGIAYVAADKGIQVRMKDLNHQALASGFAAARDIWDKLLKRKRLNSYEMTQKMNLISGGTDYSGLSSST